MKTQGPSGETQFHRIGAPLFRCSPELTVARGCMLEQGKVRENSGGGSFRYRRASRHLEPNSFTRKRLLIYGIGNRVALDLFSSFHCVRFSRLHVITRRGPSHGKQKSDDKG